MEDETASRQDQLNAALAAVGEALKTLAFWAALLALVLIRGLLALLAQMCHFASLVATSVAKVAIVAFLVLATLNAAIMVWRAYGADLPSLIPAALLIIVMAALGLKGGNWGALLLGGLVALAIGATIGLADIVTRSLIITGVLATTIAQTQLHTESDNHGKEQESQPGLRDPDQDRPGPLYDAADG